MGRGGSASGQHQVGSRGRQAGCGACAGPHWHPAASITPGSDVGAADGPQAGMGAAARRSRRRLARLAPLRGAETAARLGHGTRCSPDQSLPRISACGWVGGSVAPLTLHLPCHRPCRAAANPPNRRASHPCGFAPHSVDPCCCQLHPIDAPPPSFQMVVDPDRPRFHVHPPQGWMNDPNGAAGQCCTCVWLCCACLPASVCACAAQASMMRG